MHFKDSAVEEFLIKRFDHQPPFSEKELSQIEELVLDSVHSLEDLSNFPNVTFLFIENSSLVTLDGLAHLSKLDWIQINRTTLHDISALAGMSGFGRIDLQYNLIENLSPLVTVKEVRRVMLRGNPLSIESYEEVVPRLREGGIDVQISSPESWELTRHLNEKGIQASFESLKTSSRLYCLTSAFIEKLDGPEHRFAVIEPDTLRQELEAGVDSCEELFERYETSQAALNKEAYRQQASGNEVASWIDNAGLDPEEAGRLRGYIERFFDHQFVREDQECLDQWASSRGARWNRKLRSLPDWYIAYRRAVGWPELDGQPAVMIFDRSLCERLPQKTPFTLTPIGAKTESLQIALVDNHQIFPIGYGGENARWILGIDIAHDEKRVFVFSADDVFSWDFDPREEVAFESLGLLFEAVSEIRPGSQTKNTLGDLDDEPPTIEFDIETHQYRGDVEMLRDRASASTLSTSFTREVINLVEEFPDLCPVAEDIELIEYHELLNQMRLPAWYRELRQVFARFEFDEKPTEFIFGDWTDWETRTFRMQPPKIRPTNAIYKHGFFPIATSSNHFLIIRLDDEQDQKIYWCAIDEVGSDLFEAVPAFDDIAQMFAQVTSIKVAFIDKRFQRQKV